jgi:hypothetical protein
MGQIAFYGQYPRVLPRSTAREPSCRQEGRDSWRQDGPVEKKSPARPAGVSARTRCRDRGRRPADRVLVIDHPEIFRPLQHVMKYRTYFLNLTHLRFLTDWMSILSL